VSACASIGPLTSPDVTLADLKFTDLTVFETTGEITVRISNENPEPLSIDGAVFKLFLNGVSVGKALTSERVEIPRLGTSTLRATVHLNNVALITRLATMIEQPELEYRIRTKLFVVRPYGTRKWKLDHQGRFSFADTPASEIEQSVQEIGAGAEGR
jgi:LEA14-like dessication related protein